MERKDPHLYHGSKQHNLMGVDIKITGPLDNMLQKKAQTDKRYR